MLLELGISTDGEGKFIHELSGMLTNFFLGIWEIFVGKFDVRITRIFVLDSGQIGALVDLRFLSWE